MISTIFLEKEFNMALKTSPRCCKAKQPENTYWGYHLILDCKSCNRESLRDEKNIKTFVKALVEGIDMVAYGEPTLAHFATHNEHAAGYSLVQLIETSSITAHFAENIGELYLDVFSCKPFEIEDAKKVVEEFFNPGSIKTTYLTRQA